MSKTRPIQADDIFHLRFLQGGVFSPDGNYVVYPVSSVDFEQDKENYALWLYDLRTGEQRQLTAGHGKDKEPAWSPDSRNIVFVSDRAGAPQLYSIPVDGGEAQRLTHFKQGVSAPTYSPNGRYIAFTAGPDYGDAAPPDLTKDVYRLTRAVYRFDGMGYIDQLIQDIYLLDTKNGKTKRLTDDATLNGSLRWSPDGERILYTASMNPDSLTALFPTVHTVDLKGNSEYLFGEGFLTGAAYWSKDGESLIILGQPNDGSPIGSKNDLWVYDLAKKKLKNRTSSIPYEVGGSISTDSPIPILRSTRILLHDSGDTAYIQVQAGGNVGLYRVALTGKESHEAITSGDRVYIGLDIHGDQILALVDTYDSPPDLYIVDLPTQTEQRLTKLNAKYLKHVERNTLHHLQFPGTDGVTVEGWFLAPTHAEGPVPTILYIHGGPHAAYGNSFHFDFQLLAGAGYGVLYINHRASSGYGNAFGTAIKGDWGNLDYGDLISGVDYAIAQGLADPDRLGCCGTSGGGNLSCWIVGHTDRFKAAVPHNPVTNWNSFYGTSDIGVWFSVEQLGGHPHEIPEVYARCSPITYAHNCTTPTLMIQAEHDWRCPAEQSEQFYTVLKANGCTVEMLRQPGGSHGASRIGALNLRREHDAALLDWFGRYVKDAVPAESVKAKKTRKGKK